MATIESAIEQLEKSASKLKQLEVEESRAVREAVREATKEATTKVKDEFKTKKQQARQEARDAEKAIKEAQSRIQKALGADSAAGTATGGTRAKRGEREAQFTAYVQKNPGQKLSDIARGIGIQPSAANALAKKLVDQGKVKKSDEKTYTLA